MVSRLGHRDLLHFRVPTRERRVQSGKYLFLAVRLDGLRVLWGLAI